MNSNAFAGYESGQIWQYKTRVGEEQSLLYIVKVDEIQGYGKIYHIYVDGIKIKNPHISSGFQTYLPHAPVDESTLNQSVTKQFNGKKSMPDISDGYKAWKEPFDKGEAGVFNIPVSKIIEYIEQVVNQ